MNKMERPMMTIVRFGAEDVIATSSPALGSFVALGSELLQYKNINGSDLENPYDYSINANQLYGAYISSDSVMVDNDSPETDNIYAWYSTDSSWGWTTDNRTVISYEASGKSLPTN